MSEPRKGWIREVEYMRGFAILAVVAIHASSYSESINGSSIIPATSAYINHLSDFAVPLFFILSGFVLASKPLPRGEWGSYYRRRLKAVVPPYLFFSTLYLAYNYWVMGQTDLVQAAWSYLLFDTVGVFWFLGALIQMYLLFPILSAWLDRLIASRTAWKLPVYSGLLYVVWGVYLSGAFTGAVDALGLPTADAGERLVGFLFPGYLLFFALGMYLSRAPAPSLRRINEVSRAPLIVLAVAMPIGLMLMDSLFWLSIAIVPYTIIASSLVYRASVRLAAKPSILASLFEVLGRYSFGIYMGHILAEALVVNRLWAAGLDSSHLMFYVVMYVSAIALCIVGLFILNLLPFGTLVSGVRPKDGRRPRLWPRRAAEGERR